MELQTKLDNAVAELGITIDDVVLALRKEGIKGQPRSCSNCPIAAFIRKKLDLISDVFVNSESITIFGLHTIAAQTRLTQNIKDFIGYFDGGMNKFQEFRKINNDNS